MAVPGRLPRVVPTGDPFVVEGKVIPSGVSFMSLGIDNYYAIEIMLTRYSLQYIDNCWYFNIHYAQF